MPGQAFLGMAGKMLLHDFTEAKFTLLKVDNIDRTFMLPPFDGGPGGVLGAVIADATPAYIQEAVLQASELVTATDYLGNFGSINKVKIPNMTN